MTHQPFVLTKAPRLTKAGNRYEVVYYVDGKRKRMYAGTNYTDANAKAVKMFKEIAGSHQAPERDGDALIELLKTTLEVHVLELRKDTERVFRCAIKKYLKFIEENGYADARGAKITHEPIEAYRAERLKVVKPNTVRKEITCIKTLYNRLNKQDKINVDTRKVVCKKGEEGMKREPTLPTN